MRELMDSPRGAESLRDGFVCLQNGPRFGVESRGEVASL